MTLDTAQIDLSKTFEVGQGYVALSRLKNIDGLVLLGINDKAFEVDPLILHVDPHIQKASFKSKAYIESLSDEEFQNLSFEYMKKIGGLTNIDDIKNQEKKLQQKKMISKTIIFQTIIKQN